MENTVVKMPFWVKTQCPHCGSQVKINLKDVPVESTNRFQYKCQNCGKENNLLEDKNFSELAEIISSHADDFRKWIKESLVEMSIQLMNKAGNLLDLDEEVLELFKKMSQEDLRKSLLKYLEDKSPEIELK